LRSKKKLLHELNCWHRKVVTKDYKSLVNELYDACEIKRNTVIADHQFLRIANILQSRYSGSTFPRTFVSDGLIAKLLPDLNLRIFEGLSERNKYKINMQMIFPTGALSPLSELSTTVTPLNIIFLPDLLQDEEHPIGHYLLCGKLDSLILPKEFCEGCNGLVSSNIAHRCPKRCPMCSGYCAGTRHHSSDRNTINCKDCNINFRSQQCFEIHKRRKTCSKRKKCPKCNRIYLTKSKHLHCGDIKCLTCKEWYTQEETETHKCFISDQIGDDLSLQSGEHKVFLDFGTVDIF